MKNISSRISKAEQKVKRGEMCPPPILENWTNEEVAMVEAALGEKWPGVVIVDDILVPERPPRPVKELMDEWNRQTRPVPRGWRYARK